MSLHGYLYHGRHRKPIKHGKALVWGVLVIPIASFHVHDTSDIETAVAGFGKADRPVIVGLEERRAVAASRSNRRAMRQELRMVKSQRSKPKPKPKPKWIAPLRKFQTTSCYGWRWGSLHSGIDLAAPTGTPILAAGDGKVTQAGWKFGGYGYSVMVDHGGYTTFYGHASKIFAKVGQKVKRGDKIAAVGSTGFSTGPHLHLNVGKTSNPWGSWFDPQPWFRQRGVNLGC